MPCLGSTRDGLPGGCLSDALHERARRICRDVLSCMWPYSLAGRPTQLRGECLLDAVSGCWGAVSAAARDANGGGAQWRGGRRLSAWIGARGILPRRLREITHSECFYTPARCPGGMPHIEAPVTGCQSKEGFSETRARYLHNLWKLFCLEANNGFEVRTPIYSKYPRSVLCGRVSLHLFGGLRCRPDGVRDLSHVNPDAGR